MAKRIKHPYNDEISFTPNEAAKYIVLDWLDRAQCGFGDMWEHGNELSSKDHDEVERLLAKQVARVIKLMNLRGW